MKLEIWRLAAVIWCLRSNICTRPNGLRPSQRGLANGQHGRPGLAYGQHEHRGRADVGMGQTAGRTDTGRDNGMNKVMYIASGSINNWDSAIEFFYKYQHRRRITKQHDF